jgi:hypothetical protein
MNAEAIQILVLKLKDAARLLRLTDDDSGLVLEKEIDPKRPVLPQQQQLLTLFETALSHAAMLSA